MSSTRSLPTVVDTLEDKARKQKQAENTQFHVSVAEHNIREVNQELKELMTQLRDLKYYKEVLEEAFDGDAPAMTGNAVTAAKKITNVSQDTLLEYVQSDEIDDDVELEEDKENEQPKVELTSEVQKHIDQIRSVKRQVKTVSDRLVQDLELKRENWRKKVSAAEELQQIIGAGGSDFAKALNRMHTLLTQELLDTDGGARNFIVQWDSAINEWEEHQSLQSLDDFQKKHGLSDATIDDVERLSKSKKLTLADVSLDTLEEMKGVNELASSVDLNL